MGRKKVATWKLLALWIVGLGVLLAVAIALPVGGAEEREASTSSTDDASDYPDSPTAPTPEPTTSTPTETTSPSTSSSSSAPDATRGLLSRPDKMSSYPSADLERCASSLDTHAYELASGVTLCGGIVDLEDGTQRWDGRFPGVDLHFDEPVTESEAIEQIQSVLPAGARVDDSSTAQNPEGASYGDASCRHLDIESEELSPMQSMVVQELEGPYAATINPGRVHAILYSGYDDGEFLASTAYTTDHVEYALVSIFESESHVC